ncbi:MAG: LytTR family DNA-binding domain-containing protein [Ferruginibacter sp.]
MLKYSCIIVEDEPLSAEVLIDYIKEIPWLELKKVCSDAIYAMEALRYETIDLIFLDIHLPKIKGFEFLASLKTHPHIIITSAYKDYALQAFDENVIDYLLKPIRFSRFLKAVNKLTQQFEVNAKPLPTSLIPAERPHLFFNVDKKRVKIHLDEILYIESIRDYILITTKNHSVYTKFKLSEMEDLLTHKNFIRVHRSFIVAKDKITAFSATDVEIEKKTIPIGRSYKELVIASLEKGR